MLQRRGAKANYAQKAGEASGGLVDYSFFTSAQSVNLFSRLHQHARSRPDAVALFSRYRPITYRKLWSRLERASARIQGEWHIGSGDIVLYHGHAHPDALLLYLSLARSGAMLLALEPAASASPALPHLERGESRRWAAQLAWLQSSSCQGVRHVLVDDSDDALPALALPWPVSPLSALIATPCPHPAGGSTEDMARPSLVCWTGTADPAASAEAENPQLFSLACLGQQAAQPATAERVSRHLFVPSVLGGLVLPRLLAGESILIG